MPPLQLLLQLLLLLLLLFKFSVACSKTLDEKIKYKITGGRKDKNINCRNVLDYKTEVLNILCHGPAVGVWRNLRTLLREIYLNA